THVAQCAHRGSDGLELQVVRGPLERRDREAYRHDPVTAERGALGRHPAHRGVARTVQRVDEGAVAVPRTPHPRPDGVHAAPALLAAPAPAGDARVAKPNDVVDGSAHHLTERPEADDPHSGELRDSEAGRSGTPPPGLPEPSVRGE